MIEAIDRHGGFINNLASRIEQLTKEYPARFVG
jgi:hypothetical protein